MASPPIPPVDRILIPAILAAAATPIVLTVVQILVWLRYGRWPNWNGTMLTGVIYTGWLGFDRALNWLLSQQLSLLAILVFCSLVMVLDRLENKSS